MLFGTGQRPRLDRRLEAEPPNCRRPIHRKKASPKPQGGEISTGAACRSSPWRLNINPNSFLMEFACTASFRSSPLHLDLHGLHLPPHIPLQFRQSPRLSPPLRLSPSSVSDNATGLRTIRRGAIRIREDSEMRDRKFRVRSSAEETSPHFSTRTRVIAVSSAATVILAVANRVLYKLALVPMKQYPFFLAQFTTFGYVSVILLCLEYLFPLLSFSLQLERVHFECT